MKKINYGGQEYTQVQKRTAEKLFKEGKTIYLLPCKVCHVGTWVHFIDVNISRYDSYDLQRFTDNGHCPFQQTIADFTWYNCNSDLGLHASFYIIK